MVIAQKTEEMLIGKYTENDLTAYENIIRQTNFSYQDFNPSSHYQRSSGSWKWGNILAPIRKKWRKESNAKRNGDSLIAKKDVRIWKAKRHFGKGIRKLHDDVYLKSGHSLYEFLGSF